MQRDTARTRSKGPVARGSVELDWSSRVGVPDPAELSACALVALYRKRVLSPVEALSSIFARVDRLEPTFNTFRLLDREGALAAAASSARRWQSGTPRGPLDGVPVTLKDLLDVQGWPTRRGSLATLDTPAEHDSPAAARLREAGAVLFGKTNTAEFGWKSVTESALAGITRNPWHPEHTPTGSSGGAAAACALRFGPLHVGTDGGGSIRVPAAACGVFGLKPSYGRVASFPPAYNRALFHVGPIARSVEDAALLLNVLARPDTRDGAAFASVERDFRVGLGDGVEGVRVAYSRTLGYATVNPAVAAVVDRAVGRFAALGAVVDEVDPGFPEPSRVLEAFAAERALRLRRDIPVERFALIDAVIRRAVEQSENGSLAAYVEAQDERLALVSHMSRFHERYELLLTPTSAVRVPKLGVTSDAPFSVPFNVTGQPAASVPCGFDDDGLPVGLQIVGPPGRDELVLRAARAFESLEPFARLCP